MFELINNPNFAINIDPETVPEEGHRASYNRPNRPEIAGVVVGDPYSLRPILVRKRCEDGSNHLQMIQDYHPSYDGMQYPLLLSHGNFGFHPKIQQCL